MTNIDKLAVILMVEDNPMDITLTKMMFTDNRVRLNLSCLRDGEECIEYLSSAALNGAGSPDLVLLDLNLPKMDGREVLQFIKENDHLKSIPVAIVSGSSAQEDIDEANKLGATLYLVKPIDVSSLEHITEKVGTLQLIRHEEQHYLIRAD